MSRLMLAHTRAWNRMPDHDTLCDLCPHIMGKFDRNRRSTQMHAGRAVLFIFYDEELD